MLSDLAMRRVFVAATAVNLGGGFFFGLQLGTLTGLPPAPAIYRALTAMFIWLFAGMYAYLAMQATFPRPLVWLGAIGKGSAFLITALLWMASALPARSVVVMTVDLVFALIFLAWLVKAPRA